MRASPAPTPGSPARSRTWALRLVGIGTLAALTAWCWRSSWAGREEARAAQCRGNLYQIGFALRLYRDRHGTLPPAHLTNAHGKPVHSWRALLLCDWRETGFGDRYRRDEPWDGPHNRTLVRDPARRLFACPDDPGAADASATSYVAVIGGGTPRSGGGHRRRTAPGGPPPDTILIVERPGSGIGWLEPRDLTAGQALRLFAPEGRRVRSPHGKGLNYVTVGPGGERLGVLPPDITAERLAEILQVEAAGATPQ